MRIVIVIAAAALLVASPAWAGLIFVRADGSGDYATIQAAINAASSGSIIELADGVYQGAGNRDIDPLGKSITIRSASGRPASCVIDCQALGRGFYIHTAETSATVIKGIKILNGDADYGGGIRVDSASPTLVNLVVQDCTATSDGGGAYLYNASSIFDNNIVTGNQAGTHGGGLYVRGGPPTFYNDLIVGNDAFTCGGMFIYGSDVQVRSCSFSENSADDSNGGIALRGESGGGATLTNCIVGSNPGPGSTIVSALVTYSCVWGGFPGTGNIDANPQFTTGTGGNYYLAGTSPCLNTGSAAASGLCFIAGDGSVCLSQLTTRATEVNDSGFVDMGYHYGHYNGVSVPGTWSTIQTAIDNSFSGEQINVAPGTRYERINFHGKALTLASTGGRDVTTIDGSSAGTVVSFLTSEGRGSILRGFTISHGSGSTGGGIVGEQVGPTIDDCAISLNSASNSGAGAAFSFGRPRFQGCWIYGNVAGTDGGGMWLAGGGSKPEIDACVFESNNAVNGAGLYLAWATCAINGSSFPRCYATGLGGGLYAYTSTVTVTGSTFYLSYGNGTGAGAGIHMEGGTLNIDHTLIAFNTAGQSIGCTGTPTLTVSCCDFFSNAGGNWSGCVAGMDAINNNFTLDPLFCDINTGPTVHANSPCLAANHAACGQVGVGGQGCDATLLFVKPDGSGTAATIQAAIDASSSGGIVLLSDGTFTGTGNRDLDFKGKKLTLKSNSDDPTRSIIDCQGTSGTPHRGFYFHTGEDSSSVLQSVTIRNAWTNYGAGINCLSSNPKILNCIFYNNHATVDGGGMMAQLGSPILEDCRFELNSADDAGGGLMNNTSSPWLRRCQFTQNSGHWGGGGVYNHLAAPILRRCTFVDNESDAWGGAIHSNLSGSNPNLYNCVLAGNTAPYGGAIYNRNSAHPVLTNCTLYGNGDASTLGGGIYSTQSSVVDLDRCILSGNTGGATVCAGSSSVTAVCCDVWGNPGGDWTGCLAGQSGSNGNISLNPLFCNVGDLDFTIADTSPCAPANNMACGLVGALNPACSQSAVDGPPVEGMMPVVALAPGAPNPFSSSTTLRYELPSPEQVRLTVYSLDGRRVALLVDRDMPAGLHSIFWNGVDELDRPLASGIYIVELRAGSQRATQRLMLTR